tara:strand:+ start:584 stop:775 length:192 start_codon:yes stop_codon:yes gene_type:complete
MNKHIQNTGYFLVGSAVITAMACKTVFTYAKTGVETCVEIGKREYCTEPLHNHHDGCPECDIT